MVITVPNRAEAVSGKMRAVPGPSSVSNLDYPPAERGDQIDELHGTPVADPYRWLEDREDPRTAEWLTRQDALYAAWRDQSSVSDAG
jgi:hypothetical protein